MSRYQKGKTSLHFTEARDSEWQWHQLGHMQVCTFLQTDNHASTPPLSFLQAGCPYCRPTNSITAVFPCLEYICLIKMQQVDDIYLNWSYGETADGTLGCKQPAIAHMTGTAYTTLKSLKHTSTPTTLAVHYACLSPGHLYHYYYYSKSYTKYTHTPI